MNPVRFFTSYYGRRGLPVKRCLAITPVVPIDYPGIRESRLAPSLSLSKSFAVTPRDEWQSMYHGLLLQKITPMAAAQLVDRRILLAHETDPKNSFRGMVVEYLRFHGIDASCSEWGGETEDQMDQRELPL